MITYDVLARTTSVIVDKYQNVLYYFIYFLRNNYYISIFLMFIIASYFVINKFKIDLGNNKYIKICILVWTFIPLILFSLSKTRLVWYINPIYPGLSILIAMITYSIYKSEKTSKYMRVTIIALLLICYALGEFTIINKINKDTIPTSQTFLIALKRDSTLKNSTIYSDDWSQSNMFITEVLCGFNPKTTSLQEYVNSKVEGLYLMDNNKSNKLFVEKNKLEIKDENNNYIIIKQ